MRATALLSRSQHRGLVDDSCRPRVCLYYCTLPLCSTTACRCNCLTKQVKLAQRSGWSRTMNSQDVQYFFCTLPSSWCLFIDDVTEEESTRILAAGGYCQHHTRQPGQRLQRDFCSIVHMGARLATILLAWTAVCQIPHISPSFIVAKSPVYGAAFSVPHANQAGR